MPLFKKKPVVIEAVQFTGDNCIEIIRFMGGPADNLELHNSDTPVIHTLEGDLTASDGDWIIKGVKGEFYPCKPDVSTRRSLTMNLVIKWNRIVLPLTAVLLCVLTVGCHVTAAAPPPPPGAVNATDAQANEILQPIAAFAASLSAQVKAGTVTLPQNVRTALDSLNALLNTADEAEIAYHNSGGSGSATALTAALTAVQQSFNTLQGQLPKP